MARAVEAVSIGELDQRISIEAKVEAPDGMGGRVVTWSPLATVWARAVPVPGRKSWEAVQQGELTESGIYTFTIRRRADLVATMRVLWNSQIFNVRFVADPGTRALYQTLNCEQGVAV